MAIKKEYFKSKIFYFFSLAFLIYLCTSIQALFFAQLSTPWFHVDLVSITVAYICVEQTIWIATFAAVIAGFLFQTNATSPHLFFVLYFLLLVVISNIVAHFFVLTGRFSKTILFVLLFLVKYIFFFFSLSNRYEIGIFPLISVYWKEYLATVLVSFFAYQVLYYFDSLFMLPGTLKKR
jgi:hypothetical protein